MQNMYDEKGVKMNKLLKYTFMLLCCFLLMGCLPLDKETDKKVLFAQRMPNIIGYKKLLGRIIQHLNLLYLLKMELIYIVISQQFKI